MPLCECWVSSSPPLFAPECRLTVVVQNTVNTMLLWQEGHPGCDHGVAICGDHPVLLAIPCVNMGSQVPSDKDNHPSDSVDNDGLNISPHYFIYIERSSRICEKETRNI